MEVFKLCMLIKDPNMTETFHTLPYIYIYIKISRHGNMPGHNYWIFRLNIVLNLTVNKAVEYFIRYNCFTLNNHVCHVTLELFFLILELYMR